MEKKEHYFALTARASKASEFVRAAMLVMALGDLCAHSLNFGRLGQEPLDSLKLLDGLGQPATSLKVFFRRNLVATWPDSSNHRLPPVFPYRVW